MTARAPRASGERASPALPRVGVSACLLGEAVRYDGGHKRDAPLLRALGRRVEWVPVCPEVEAGFGVPREPIRLEGDPRRPRVRVVATGEDVTRRLLDAARPRLDALAALRISGYVLKSGSPSCGRRGVRVRRASGRDVHAGVGAFARALVARFPGLPVEDEARLRDPARRRRFLARVVARAARTARTGDAAAR